MMISEQVEAKAKRLAKEKNEPMAVCAVENPLTGRKVIRVYPENHTLLGDDGPFDGRVLALAFPCGAFEIFELS